MKHAIRIILALLLCTACQGRRKEAPRDLPQDSLRKVEVVAEPDTMPKREWSKSPAQLERERRNKALRQKMEQMNGPGLNDDALRGFDPATEDDQPDNGMQRYMENNDEKGWL